MSHAALLVLAWTLAAAGFSAVTLLRVLRLRAAAPAGPLPPLLLLRPVDEPTPAELDTLAAPLPPGLPVRHVVLSPYRPRLADGLSWHFSDPPCPNRKVGHVLYAVDTLRRPGEQVLVVDADVRVDQALLEGLSRVLASGAALATAAPAPVGGSGPGAAAFRGLLRSSQHSFVALDAMSVGPKALCGKALGLSPSALEALRMLDGHIGEDLELSLLLHRRGLAVVRTPSPAWMPLDGAVPLRGVLRRLRRWMQVLRAHRPGLFPTVPLLLAPTPLVLVLALGAGARVVAGAVALLVAFRIALGIVLRRGSPDAVEGAWEWLLGEAVLLAAWTASLGVRTVDWRGRRFTLRSGGRMERAVEGGDS